MIQGIHVFTESLMKYAYFLVSQIIYISEEHIFSAENPEIRFTSDVKNILSFRAVSY